MRAPQNSGELSNRENIGFWTLWNFIERSGGGFREDTMSVFLPTWTSRFPFSSCTWNSLHCCREAYFLLWQYGKPKALFCVFQFFFSFFSMWSAIFPFRFWQPFVFFADSYPFEQKSEFVFIGFVKPFCYGRFTWMLFGWIHFGTPSFLSIWRESNPHVGLGGPAFYHWNTDACFLELTGFEPASQQCDCRIMPNRPKPLWKFQNTVRLPVLIVISCNFSLFIILYII